MAGSGELIMSLTCAIKNCHNIPKYQYDKIFLCNNHKSYYSNKIKSLNARLSHDRWIQKYGNRINGTKIYRRVRRREIEDGVNNGNK